MGYSVLYTAFGIVALWLLGEVLLQYKARLRWRLLAFAGFMGVVGGVALREVVLIVLGAVAFGTGQAFVTLSHRRGFSTGWALGGRPGSSRRRKGARPRVTEPTLAVTPVEESAAYAYEGAAGAADTVGEGSAADEVPTGQDDPSTQVYQPVPLHEDSGEYPLYEGQPAYTADPYAGGGYEGYGAQGYGGWGGDTQPHPQADPRPAAATASYENGGYQQQPGWGGDQGYGYGYEQGGYQEQSAGSGYGTGGYGAYGGYEGYDGAQATATGDWTPQPPHQEPHYEQNSHQEPRPQPDPYAAGYGYDPQGQPYIPQQPHQPPYEPQEQQPQYAAEYAEYADPHDPYRY